MGGGYVALGQEVSDTRAITTSDMTEGLLADCTNHQSKLPSNLYGCSMHQYKL